MLINNRYRVISTLGEGGFGHAYLAEDTQMPSQRRCVLKQLKPVTTSPDAYQVVKERFQREAAILEKLGEDHRQIPRLYAYFSEDQQFYLVQEWIEGKTLEEIVSTQGILSEAVVKSILLALLPALDFIHAQGIIHRDLKPDNIMLRAGQIGQGPQPVLIDFGAVRETMGTVFNSRQHPTSSIVIGTPGYMASEQAAGRPLPSSDLYSLGLTAIYLLTGRIPQSLESDPQTGEILWRQLAGQVSSGLVEVLDKAVRSHPRDRYSSASQMLAALSALPGVGASPSQMPLVSAYQPAADSSLPVVMAPASTASTFKTVVAAPGAQASSTYRATDSQTVQASSRSLSQVPTDTVVSGVNRQPATRFSPLLIGMVIVAIGGAAAVGGMLLRQPTDEATVQPTASQRPSADAETEDDAESDADSIEAPSPESEEPLAETSDDDGTGQTAPSAPSSGGQEVTLRSSKGSQISLYESPSFAAQSSGGVTNGDRVTILQESTGDDGKGWYRVRSESGAEGWVSQDYAGSGSVSSSSGSNRSAPPPAAPAPEPPPAAAKPSQSPQLVGGAAGGQVDVYSSPSYSASSPHYGLVGDRVTVLNSAQGDDGRTWVQIQFASGAVGWVSADSVQ